MIEWFDADPGIHEATSSSSTTRTGGPHTYDFMQIARSSTRGGGGLVASSSYTADNGCRGAATEIFHEGIRPLGLKIVEGGVFQDVSRRS
jgi:hypothetical protein